MDGVGGGCAIRDRINWPSVDWGCRIPCLGCRGHRRCGMRPCLRGASGPVTALSMLETMSFSQLLGLEPRLSGHDKYPSGVCSWFCSNARPPSSKYIHRRASPGVATANAGSLDASSWARCEWYYGSWTVTPETVMGPPVPAVVTVAIKVIQPPACCNGRRRWKQDGSSGQASYLELTDAIPTPRAGRDWA